MNKKKLLFLLTLFVLVIGNLFAQDGKYFKSKTNIYAKEVFKNCMSYAEEPFFSTYEEWMSRVEVKKVDKSISTSFPSLSTVTIREKCNTDLLVEPEKFSVAQFNPLKYFFDFTSKEELTYRIDNSDYIVIIHAVVK